MSAKLILFGVETGINSEAGRLVDKLNKKKIE